MPKKATYALGGIGIAIAVLIVLVLASVISISFLSPLAMLAIGGIGVMILVVTWFFHAIWEMKSPRPNVQTAATIGFGLWIDRFSGKCSNHCYLTAGSPACHDSCCCLGGRTRHSYWHVGSFC